jgi:hypothetical protein
MLGCGRESKTHRSHGEASSLLSCHTERKLGKQASTPSMEGEWGSNKQGQESQAQCLQTSEEGHRATHPDHSESLSFPKQDARKEETGRRKELLVEKTL